MQSTNIKDWPEAISTKSTITPEFRAARNLVQPENLKFNSTFLQICSHFYFLFYHQFEGSPKNQANLLPSGRPNTLTTNLIEKGNTGQFSEALENPEMQSFIFEGRSIDIENEDYLNEKNDLKIEIQDLKNENEKEEIVSGLRHFTFLETSSDPKSLPFSLALQEQLSETVLSPKSSLDASNSAFEFDFKTHATLLDSNKELLEKPIIDWVYGMARENGQRQYGFGSDALRLLCASIDQTNFGTMEATLTAEMLNVKQSEINVLRKVFSDLLKNADGEEGVLDVAEEELFLPVLGGVKYMLRGPSF